MAWLHEPGSGFQVDGVTMKTDKERGQLVYALRHLPENGRRLRGGLALRLSRGNGVTVLGCSRVRVPPSETEMETVIAAVAEAFEPSVIWLAAEPEKKEVAWLPEGEETAVVEVHYIWRVYWPEEGLRAVWRPSAGQLTLFW